MNYYDELTVSRIEKIHPKLRAELHADYLEINSKLPRSKRLRITQTLRTFKEQTDLYAKGRTSAGAKVTNAKAGQSFHNYGFAFDICILEYINGTWKTSFDASSKEWKQVVDFFKSKGWKWGGDFLGFKDKPHFEKTFGKGWAYYLDLHNRGVVDAEGFVKF